MNKLQKTILAIVVSIFCAWSNIAHAQWVQANTGLPINEVNSFATIGTTIFASTGNISGNGQGVYKSVDNGNNWTASNSGLVSLDTRKIIAVEDTLFVAIAGTNLTDGGIYKSIDKGATWTASNNGLLRNIAYSIVHLNGILYTGISAPSSQKAVYTSSDYGRNWTITNSTVLNNNTIKSIVKVGGNILAASDGGTRGVYISKDNGATWDTTSIKSETDALAVLGTTVFAATGIGVKKSSDNGLTWTTTKNVSGVIDNAITLAVIGNCLLVGTPGGSVYSTSDNGASWNNVSTGTSLNLAPEAFGMTAGFLFAGVNFKTVGIWKRAISEFGCTSVGSNLAEENFSSFQIYPNPSAGIFNISSSSNISEVEIHTTLGEKIYDKKVNSESTSINLSDKPKGVYFYQVIDNSSVLKSGRIIIE